MCEKSVLDHIPCTQHRPMCDYLAIVPQATTSRTRFNLKKANWDWFSTEFDAAIKAVNSFPKIMEGSKNYYVWYTEDTFQGVVDQTTYLISQRSPSVSMKHTKDSIQATILAKVHWRLEQS